MKSNQNALTLCTAPFFRSCFANKER